MTAAPGVAYFALEGCSRQFFRCAPYRATVSVSACADRWNAAQRADPHEAYRFEKCRACPAGAAHAGRLYVHYSAYFGSSICPRCRNFATRMIGGTRCVSCANREYEFVKGKNGHGNPVTFRFDRRRIGVVTESGYVEVANDRTTDIAELMLNVLRSVHGRVSFCRPSGTSAAITTAQFARRYKPVERKAAGAARGAGRRASTTA